MSNKELSSKIKNRKAVIGIVGLGYVGLPLAIRFAQEGFRTIGFDIDTEKINKINAGESYIHYIKDTTIRSITNAFFNPTSDYSRAKDVDCLIICVPTPLNKYHEPDLSFVTNTLDSMLHYLRKGSLCSLESTTYPGTTSEEITSRISKMGFEVGQDFFVVFSPEREDPGNESYSTKTIPKVVGGETEFCLELGIELYESVVERVIPVSSTRAAEMTKLLENIQRAVNIGMMNELKILCEKMDIDIFEVIDAASTKPFGFARYVPGPGLGGHCIPIDPFYLTWKAKEYGIHTRFIELAGEINSAMPDYVISKLTDALNRFGKSLKGSRILVLGLAYKKNVDDVRESPSVSILEKLRKKEADFYYSDRFFPEFPKMREHSFKLTSTEISIESLESFDAVVLSTDHDYFDYDLIQIHSKLIIDTRGRFSFKNPKVIRA